MLMQAPASCWHSRVQHRGSVPGTFGHVTSAVLHSPDSASHHAYWQRSTPWQVLPFVWHTPNIQNSPAVQAMWSSHGVPLGVPGLLHTSSAVVVVVDDVVLVVVLLV